MTTKFRQLPIGAEFDWIDESAPSRNSFFWRCRKVSARHYETISQNVVRFAVGTINAKVFHVS